MNYLNYIFYTLSDKVELLLVIILRSKISIKNYFIFSFVRV